MVNNNARTDAGDTSPPGKPSYGRGKPSTHASPPHTHRLLSIPFDRPYDGRADYVSRFRSCLFLTPRATKSRRTIYIHIYHFRFPLVTRKCFLRARTTDKEKRVNAVSVGGVGRWLANIIPGGGGGGSCRVYSRVIYHAPATPYCVLSKAKRFDLVTYTYTLTHTRLFYTVRARVLRADLLRRRSGGGTLSASRRIDYSDTGAYRYKVRTFYKETVDERSCITVRRGV